MKLLVQINGAAQEVEILAPGPDCRYRFGHGEERTANVELPEPGAFSILTNGRIYEARVEETLDGLVVVVDGHRFEIEVQDPRRWKAKAAGTGGEGIATMRALMPGKVVRVLAVPGDLVEAGQGILVVEAMKMQNEMKAPRAGRVLKISVQAGSAVAAGDVLATIE
jgi:biotin carboxyl carrier protein